MTLLWHQGQARLREKQQARARDLLEAVSMGHGASHRAGRLSSGKQQRVAIARAPINDSSVIPATGNLATRTGRIAKLLATFTRERQKIAMLVTHDERLADVADVRMELLEGRLRTG